MTQISQLLESDVDELAISSLASRKRNRRIVDVDDLDTGSEDEDLDSPPPVKKNKVSVL
jgi:hypothetical protein